MHTLEKARRFIYRNARPLDLARWQYHFENGSKEAVIHALSYYQNADGGFGYALEPDLWNEQSSPVSTASATGILREIDFYDCSNKMIKAILDYFENTSFQHHNGWLLKIPSNNDFPHSPWWEYSKETEMGFDGAAEYNPTAGIVSFIVKAADKSSALYKKAMDTANKAAQKVTNHDAIEMHEAGGLVDMFANINLADITHTPELLLQQLKNMISNVIEKDTSKWDSYIAKPSSFFNSTNSIFYADNKEIAEYECDYIITTQLPDGSWDIPWRWEGYPEEWAVAKNWWKSIGILENMLYLKGMNRIENAY